MKKQAKNHFRVAIFGSARIKKGNPEYKLVHTLAKMIGKGGMDIVTGGGPGLMDAASRGHHAGKKNHDVHTLGLTINLPREQKDSYHLDIKQDFDRFSGRLDKFMELSNVVVVAPGGVGTTLEFFYTWQLMQVEHICDTPLILMGEMWSSLLKWVEKYPLKRKLLDKKDLDSLFVVKNCSEAMSIIKHAHEHFKKDGKNICSNMKKYGKTRLRKK